MNNAPEPTIVNMAFGSHLYGLNTPNSDFDYKGIYLPTLESMILGNYGGTYKWSTGAAHEKNNAGDIDYEVISLNKFLSHACDGETFVIDMLHCNEPLVTSPIWEDLVANRTMFYSKSLKAYFGYVKKQAAKYGLKGTRLADIRQVIESLGNYDPNITLREAELIYTGEYAKWVNVPSKREPDKVQMFFEVNSKKYQESNKVGYVINELQKVWDSYGARAKLAEKNEGVDWKAISHALRGGYQARDIYKLGDYSYPLRETDFILDVKLGKLDYKSEVAPVLESLVEEVEALAKVSTFPKDVDRKYWGYWFVETVLKYNEIDDYTINDFQNFSV